MNPVDNFGWDWFLDYGIWVLVTIAIAIGLFWALRRWVPKWIAAGITRVTPKGADWSRASRVLSHIIIWIGSAVILAAWFRRSGDSYFGSGICRAATCQEYAAQTGTGKCHTQGKKEIAGGS